MSLSFDVSICSCGAKYFEKCFICSHLENCNGNLNSDNVCSDSCEMSSSDAWFSFFTLNNQAIVEEEESYVNVLNIQENDQTYYLDGTRSENFINLCGMIYLSALNNRPICETSSIIRNIQSLIQCDFTNVIPKSIDELNKVDINNISISIPKKNFVNSDEIFMNMTQIDKRSVQTIHNGKNVTLNFQNKNTVFFKEFSEVECDLPDFYKAKTWQFKLVGINTTIGYMCSGSYLSLDKYVGFYEAVVANLGRKFYFVKNQKKNECSFVEILGLLRSEHVHDNNIFLKFGRYYRDHTFLDNYWNKDSSPLSYSNSMFEYSLITKLGPRFKCDLFILIGVTTKGVNLQAYAAASDANKVIYADIKSVNNSKTIAVGETNHPVYYIDVTNDVSVKEFYLKNLSNLENVNTVRIHEDRKSVV